MFEFTFQADSYMIFLYEVYSRYLLSYAPHRITAARQIASFDHRAEFILHPGRSITIDDALRLLRV